MRRPDSLSVLKAFNRAKDSSPDGLALPIAALGKRIRPQGSMETDIGAVALHVEVGGSPDVDLFHCTAKHGRLRNRMKRLTAILFALALATPATAEMRCDIDSKFQCSAGGGCKSMDRTIYNLVDLEQLRYSRCDASQCDHMQMNASRSGLFINMEIPGSGMIAKMTLDGSEFTEIATLSTTAFISFGSCRR